MKSSLNSLMTLSPYSNYERRGDTQLAIVSHNRKLTLGTGLDSTLFPTLPALTPTEKYSYGIKLTGGK
jgi:hypothetical protein